MRGAVYLVMRSMRIDSHCEIFSKSAYYLLIYIDYIFLLEGKGECLTSLDMWSTVSQPSC